MKPEPLTKTKRGFEAIGGYMVCGFCKKVIMIKHLVKETTLGIKDEHICEEAYWMKKEDLKDLAKQKIQEKVDWLLKEIEKLPEKKYGERGSHYCTDANFLGGYGEAIDDVLKLIKKAFSDIEEVG